MDTTLILMGIGIAAAFVFGLCVGRLLRAWWEARKRRA